MQLEPKKNLNPGLKHGLSFHSNSGLLKKLWILEKIRIWQFRPKIKNLGFKKLKKILKFWLKLGLPHTKGTQERSGYFEVLENLRVTPDNSEYFIFSN